ncbi:MAG: hypothetical protein COB33_000940 [Thiotrichaceae bacterium]|nr:hypothetical protein [Thiotrichaceae bacterium]
MALQLEVTIGGNNYAGVYELLENILVVNYEDEVNRVPLNDYVKNPQALAKTILRKMVLEST